MKQKLESTLKNMVLVLTGTAILTGGILSIVNTITEKQIAEQKQKDEQAAVFDALCLNADSCIVLPADTIEKVFNDKQYEFLVYNAVDADSNIVGRAVKSVAAGFGGDLKVMVGFNADGKITGYKLLEHSETPGLGAKADQWFQKGEKGCIIGKEAGSLVTHKDDADADSLKVDAITASTITSRAFLKAVNQAYLSYAAKDEADAETGATKKN